MTIINKTPFTIKVLGRDVDPVEIKPNTSFDIFSRMFDVISIHSNVGSCIITVAYGERKYEHFGYLSIEEEGKQKIYVSELMI